jgi:hypothetical protein
MPKPVRLIGLLRLPRQVAEPVVGGIAVFVGGFHPLLGRRTSEREQDQPVNKGMVRPAVAAELNIAVAVLRDDGLPELSPRPVGQVGDTDPGCALAVVPSPR